jgi:tripartite-type tricarboxylate transporter receptor subunit TctC
MAMKHSASVLLVLGAVQSPVGAQDKPADYPRKPIRVVVGIAPGS